MRIVSILLGFVLGILVFSCSRMPVEPITMASLLEEMTDRTSLALYPYPSYKSLQFSSYDRASVTKASSSWYANWDRSQFIRTETNHGRREFVLFDVDGPGAVTRFWVTVAEYSGKGVLRFYIDGKETPEIEGEVLSIIGGEQLVGYPLAASVSDLTDYLQRGHNLYLPIPFSKSCKITYESPSIREPGEFSGECFYYNINYRKYEKGIHVESFSKSDLIKNRELIKSVQKRLLMPSYTEDRLQSVSAFRDSLCSEDSLSLHLQGTHAIRKLQVKLKSENYVQALRSTVLTIKFDGQRTVWVPVGDFMGIGNRFSAYKTYYTEVTPDSLLSCYWVMPYKKDCVISLKNESSQKIGVSLEVEYADWEWSDNTMYFGVGWKEYNHLYTGKQRDMKGTDSQFDVNFVSLVGKGVYVGDALTLFNSVADWWGEGDEKIYVDGERFPSHFGTGTEDYYGYAWCMHNFFQHPFIAEPDGTGATLCGHVANVRYRALDAIPFKESLVFDMELWHWGSAYINYAPTTYFYLFPKTKVNRGEEETSVKLKVVKHKNELVPNSPDHNGCIEGEYMDINLSSGIEKSQSISDMHWSNGAQFFWQGSGFGDIAELGFEIKNAGTYSVELYYTLAPDYGCFDVYLNGYLLKESLNCQHKILTTKCWKMGKHFLPQGMNVIKFVQKKVLPNTNPGGLGIDCLKIK